MKTSRTANASFSGVGGFELSRWAARLNGFIACGSSEDLGFANAVKGAAMRQLLAVILALAATSARGADQSLPRPSDMLILEAIAGWLPEGPSVKKGLCSVLGNEQHSPGHDYPCSITYVLDPKSCRVDIEVAEDPRWITHETESHFRRKLEQWGGRTASEKARMRPYSFEIRIMAGQRVFFGSDGEYAWTSGSNRLVQVKWLREKKLPDGTYEVRELPEDIVAYTTS